MPNHISNGVFETNTATGTAQSPDGWTTAEGSPDLNTDGNFEWSGSYMPSDLDASDGGGYLTMYSTSSYDEGVSTTLGTQVEAGQTYTFTFDYYVNDTDGTTNQPGATDLIVTIGTQTVTIPLDSTGVSAPYWQTTTFEFTAEETTSDFSIATSSDGGDLSSYTGIALDNLNLDVAPDFIVEGTGGNDLIDAAYTGDPEGDMIDANDHSDGSNADSVLAGAGDDVVIAGEGDDTVDGGAGNDTIFGGTGDDTLIGGAGADQLFGGAGNDSLQVAEGDFVDGGAGDDYITLVDYGETGNSTLTVSGGAGGESAGDTLQLGSLADLSTLSATDDGTGSFSGSVTLDDGTILNFSEIENIICFTPGTRIATPRGARRVEELAVGDTVVTRDHGIQPIRWIGRRDVPARGRLAPIRLTPGVVTGLERDILVSPQHRMLFQGYRAELLFGESEVLVPAKHLVDGLAARVEEGSTVTYIHLLCDDHEILYAEGAATESFHPGEVGLTAVTAQAREELFTIFPELRALPRSFGPTARRALRRHESRLLL